MLDFEPAVWGKAMTGSEDHRNEDDVGKHGRDKDKVRSMNIRPEELAERYFADNGASYDHIARVSTLGLDAWWKQKILKKLPPAPQRILEQACGTGILTCKIARRHPSCRRGCPRKCC